MESDPTKINDFERQMESRILATGEEYAASNKRQRSENQKRQENRNKIKEMGISTHAYQIAVKVVKDLTPGERADWMRDFQMVVKVLGAKQKELFPDEALKAEQRAQRKAEEKAGQPRDKNDLDKKTDTDPKSDPASGGAQVDLEQAIAEATARDAAEGEAILQGKSDAWRAGFNAVAAGGERGSNPFLEGGAESRDWFSGFEVATQRAFDAAAPKEVDGVAEPTPEPVVEEGATFNDGAGKPDTVKPAAAKKPSQSAKAKAKRDAAQVP